MWLAVFGSFAELKKYKLKNKTKSSFGKKLNSSQIVSRSASIGISSPFFRISLQMECN